METKSKVLSVGNCNPDHASLEGMLTTNFNVAVDRANLIEDALVALQRNRYDLVMVNRIIFDDGSEGMGLIRSMKQEPRTADIPVMLISNFEDAQKQAKSAGAVPGFGKSALSARSTIDRLAEYLGPKSTA